MSVLKELLIRQKLHKFFRIAPKKNKMSVGDSIGPNGPRKYTGQMATLSSAVQFSVFFVPLGTAMVVMTNQYSHYVVHRAETLATMTWFYPQASSCPGLYIGMCNKSAITTVTLVPFAGDFAIWTSLPPSSGIGMDTYEPTWSDGFDTWQA